MEWLYSTLALACVLLAAGWFRRRRRIARGQTCWNCGADLTRTPLYVDFKGQSRCPKCGNEMEVTDTYKLRP